MNFDTVASIVRGSDVAQVVQKTVARLQGARVAAGLVFVTGLPGLEVAAQLAQALPGGPFAGATLSGDEPGLVALWFTGDLRVAVATGPVNRALGEAAATAAGFKAFQSRLGVLLAKAGQPGLPSLFEALPKGLAFLGVDVTEAWTQAGAVEAALLLSDWPTQLAVAFEGLAATQRRKGLARASVMGSLQLQSAEVVALYGVPDRSPVEPAVATLVLSLVKERAEG